jgi:hypothetical protein
MESKENDSAGNLTGGSRAGIPNKVTRRVRHNLLACFEGIGGVDALQKWASANPGDFYKLWIKCLPQKVNHGGRVNHDHSHLVKPVSDTAAWLEGLAGIRAEAAPKEPLSH